MVNIPCIAYFLCGWALYPKGNYQLLREKKRGGNTTLLLEQSWTCYCACHGWIHANWWPVNLSIPLSAHDKQVTYLLTCLYFIYQLPKTSLTHLYFCVALQRIYVSYILVGGTYWTRSRKNDEMFGGKKERLPKMEPRLFCWCRTSRWVPKPTRRFCANKTSWIPNLDFFLFCNW